MKNVILKIIAGVLIALNIYSCSKNDNIPEENSESIITEKFSKYEKNELEKINVNSPDLYKMIDWSNYQKNEDVLTIPIVNDKKIISRIVIMQKVSYIIDYSNWKKEIQLFKFNGKTPFIKYDMVLNEQTQLYEPQLPKNISQKSQDIYACVAACAISAAYMGLADGPLPFADVAALVYLGLCIGECDANYA